MQNLKPKQKPEIDHYSSLLIQTKLANGKSRKDAFQALQYRSWKLETYFTSYLHQVLSWAQILGRTTFCIKAIFSIFHNFLECLHLIISTRNIPSPNNFPDWLCSPFSFFSSSHDMTKRILFSLEKFQDPHRWPFWSCVGVLKNSKKLPLKSILQDHSCKFNNELFKLSIS